MTLIFNYKILFIFNIVEEYNFNNEVNNWIEVKINRYIFIFYLL